MHGSVSSAQDTDPATENATLLGFAGIVETTPLEIEDWQAGTTNQLLTTGARLRTGARSRATLGLSNRSILRVYELSLLQVMPPQQPGHTSILDLKAGATYFFHRDRPTDTRFRTPQASGAIRGTEFNLEVTPEGRTVLTLIDGEVELGNEAGSIHLHSGEQAIVEEGMPPRKTAVIETINVIQWNLYYPAILHLPEIGLDGDELMTLRDSVNAYADGDLLRALAACPGNYRPTSDAGRIYLGGLLLSVGNVTEALELLDELREPSPLADAQRQLIAAVKQEPFDRGRPPRLACEWLAESYYRQSRSDLPGALAAARAAASKAHDFGFAHVRVAELEFGFGRIPEARLALAQGLMLTPRNAQALALRGFVLSAGHQFEQAETEFNRAIAVDDSLANAWLGRGLMRIRGGHTAAGRLDLEVAAALEPNRSLLRSYLGKAWHHEGDHQLAEDEIALAMRLDPNDPTPWLYSGLLSQQQNRINRSIRDLETSKSLNDNRRLFRSRFLLDQDRAVRSANLAAGYRDAGMESFAVREASRAVESDYANASAHQFLADSFDALRDPGQVNLRYETPWLSEWLVANLLSPVGGGTLSRTVSQQEYSSLFDTDHSGVYSKTEYFSRGAWSQQASQFGTWDRSSYALDLDYLSDNGQRPNEDVTSLYLSARLKHQLTPRDSILVEVSHVDFEAGDVAQYHDPSQASQTQRIEETQSPNAFAGYHREWSPGVHTLILAGRLDDRLSRADSAIPGLVLLTNANGQVTGVLPISSPPFMLDYDTSFEAYTVEGQQIWQQETTTLVSGLRYQTGESETRALLDRNSSFPVPFDSPASLQQNTTDLERFSFYTYEYWRIAEPLQLIAGLSFDHVVFPANIEVPPISDEEFQKDQLSPKLGFHWSPLPRTAFRGMYTRSLGGVFYDTSVRLEPTQIAGFNQAFRSIAPESVTGLLPGSEFDTWGLAWDQDFGSGTYLTVSSEILKSDSERTAGLFARSATNLFLPTFPSGTRQKIEFEERSVNVVLNQLVGQWVALGAHYRVSQAELRDRYPDIPEAVFQSPTADVEATLQQMRLFALANHRSGLFGQAESLWSHQTSSGYSPGLPGEDFWQFNAFVGYRFWQRRVEARLGILNLTDQDYRLNPLNLHAELPRERTFTASLKLQF